MQINLSDNALCGIDRFGGGTYTADGIKAIAESISVNPSLTQVLAYFPHFLLAISCLTTNVCAQINLEGNSIGGYNTHKGYHDDKFISTPEGPRAIADAIRVSPSITSIDLSENDFGPEAAKALAPAIAVNPSVTSVRAFGNSRSSGGRRG